MNGRDQPPQQVPSDLEGDIVDLLVNFARMTLFYATIFVSGLWWWIVPDQAGVHARFARACVWLVGLLVFGYVWSRKGVHSGKAKVLLGYWVPLSLSALGFAIGMITRFSLSTN